MNPHAAHYPVVDAVFGEGKIADHYSTVCQITQNAMGGTDRLSYTCVSENCQNNHVSRYCYEQFLATARSIDRHATHFECPKCRGQNPIAVAPRVLGETPSMTLTQTDAEELTFQCRAAETAYDVLKAQYNAANRRVSDLEMRLREQDVKHAMQLCQTWERYGDTQKKTNEMSEKTMMECEKNHNEFLKTMVPVEAVEACYLAGCKRSCSDADVIDIQAMFSHGEAKTSSQIVMTIANIACGSVSRHPPAKRARVEPPRLSDVFTTALKCFIRFSGMYAESLLHDESFNAYMQTKAPYVMTSGRHTSITQAWNKSVAIFHEWMKGGEPGERGHLQLMEMYMRFRWHEFNWPTGSDQ